jgi:hypothetical protein
MFAYLYQTQESTNFHASDGELLSKFINYLGLKAV